jgi:hypothetical protein
MPKGGSARKRPRPDVDGDGSCGGGGRRQEPYAGQTGDMPGGPGLFVKADEGDWKRAAGMEFKCFPMDEMHFTALNAQCYIASDALH